MPSLLVSDPTLRDGNHAVKHQLDAGQIALYCQAADKAGVAIVEVGHGNGLGASSLQVGEAKITDREMLQTAREHLLNAKLGIHVIPGWATIKKDLEPALDLGVDVVRVASHCTEADTTQKHIGFAREHNREVYGVLMMSHMASRETLLEEARKMESYGAEGIILMDSAGAYLPQDVTEKVGTLTENLGIPVGFHAHNNLGMAIANSVTAVHAGALILDGTARGFGAGAGNAQLEVMVAVLEKMGYQTGIDLYKILDAGDIAEKSVMKVVPTIKSMSVVSGMAGLFSAFVPHIERIAGETGVDPRDVAFALGRRKVVAGQEDMIIEVAMTLAQKSKEGEIAEIVVAA